MHADNLISHRTLDELEADLVTRAARMNAEEYAFLCDVREFDIRQGWSAYGFNNCAEWLNWKCQICPGAAREKIRVAHCLFGLPRIAAAFQNGRISYSKARPMTRIADADNEQELLDYALDRTALQVDNHCKALRNARRDLSSDDANKVYRSRFLSRSVHGDGSMTINVELPQDMGELVMKAIDRVIAAEDNIDHDPAGSQDSLYARQADALVTVAKDFLAGGSDKPASNADNYMVMVHVDESALAGRGGESDLPIETVRRITCDASLVTIVKDKDGNPLDAGRKHRIVPPHIRRALLARDKTCRFPGCTHTRHLEPHHVIHWADGGETNVDDMLMLCSRHHRLHHEGGYTIHKQNLHSTRTANDDKIDGHNQTGGGFCFRNADGKVIPQAPIYRPAVSDDDEWDSWRNTSRDALISLVTGSERRGHCDENASRDACATENASARSPTSDYVKEPVAPYSVSH